MTTPTRNLCNNNLLVNSIPKRSKKGFSKIRKKKQQHNIHAIIRLTKQPEEDLKEICRLKAMYE